MVSESIGKPRSILKGAIQAVFTVEQVDHSSVFTGATS